MDVNSLKYKGVTIKGSVFPDSPISSNLKIIPNELIKKEYIPALNIVMENDPYGFRLFLTSVTIKEGFVKGSRAHRYNNPGNIGNTDSGANKGFKTLEDGILAQRDYMLRIIEGKHSAYPLNKRVVLKPFYSPEIARNPSYGLPANLPGYDFIYTGQIDQYVKIYATGARASNGYVSTFISFFKSHGIEIFPSSKIQEIIKIEAK